MKEVRLAIDNMVLPSHDVPTRWVKVIPIKINVFMWRARRDCLPTRHNLAHKGVSLESLSCPICSSETEDIHHLLFSCSLTQEVLKRVFCRWETSVLLVGSGLPTFVFVFGMRDLVIFY